MVISRISLAAAAHPAERSSLPASHADLGRGGRALGQVDSIERASVVGGRRRRRRRHPEWLETHRRGWLSLEGDILREEGEH